VAFVVAVGLIVVRSLQGLTLIQQESSFLSLASQLLPIRIVSYGVVLLIAVCWNGLSERERVVSLGYLVVVIGGDLLVGRRGSLFILPFMMLVVWILVTVGEGSYEKIFGRKTRWRVGVALTACLLLLPFGMGLATSVKAVHHSRGSWENVEMEWMGYEDTLLMVSQRLAALDVTAAVMAQPDPSFIEPYLDGGGVLKSGVGGLVPGFVWEPDQPALGKLFSVGYQGHDWDMPHHGTWSGVGIAYALTGAGAPLVVFGYYLLVTATYRILRNTPMGIVGLSGYWLHVGVFSFVLSGNVDNLGAAFIREAVAAPLLIMLLGRYSLGSARGYSVALRTRSS
jgi:hypothetical protein